MAGRTFAHYEILSPLGAGGMGEVLRARDTRLGREVALKVLPTHLATDPQRLARFEREAILLASLNHPNIGTIHGLEQAENVNFLVLELIEGQTLADRLAEGPLLMEEALHVGQQIAAALEAAHEKGIIHRDLKPANVMLTYKGVVKVVDFGLARVARMREPSIDPHEAPTQAPELTAKGTILGTAPYMSPEQLSGEQVDARADIWSFGCVLYELLTGSRPYRHESVSGARTIIATEKPDWSTLPPGTPPAVLGLLARSLEKELDRRLRDIGEARIEIGEALRIVRGESTPDRDRPDAPAVDAATVEAATVAAAAVDAAEATKVESVAVLPLIDRSPDSSQEYFCDGMTEALIGSLAKVKALRVISMTSAMRYKGTDKPLPEIARELRVDTVLEGSVLRDGNRVRITAQIVHAASDTPLWSNSYDRDLADILSLQSEVAGAIVSELRATLTPAEEARLAIPSRVDPEAYDAYQMGRYHWAKLTEEGCSKAIGHFQEAINRDPTFPLPYAGMADSYISLGTFEFLPSADAFPKAISLASKALALDSMLAEAHASLGVAKACGNWDWAGAEASLRQAIRLSDSYASAHLWYGWLMAYMGRTQEALAECRRAQLLDPLSVAVNTYLGLFYLLDGQPDRAFQQCHRALEIDRTFQWAHLILALVYLEKSIFDEAIAEAQRAVSLLGGSATWLAALGLIYGLAGEEEQSLRILGQLQEMSTHKYVAPDAFAKVHVGLGDHGEAMRWLEKAYAQRAYGLIFIRVGPMYDTIRPDPRFQILIERMGFPA